MVGLCSINGKYEEFIQNVSSKPESEIPFVEEMRV